MAQNTARTLPKHSTVAFDQPDDDWQPLHPLHRRLVAEYSGVDATVRRRPRFGARLAVVAILAVASWAVIAVIYQLIAAAF